MAIFVDQLKLLRQQDIWNRCFNYSYSHIHTIFWLNIYNSRLNLTNYHWFCSELNLMTQSQSQHFIFLFASLFALFCSFPPSCFPYSHLVRTYLCIVAKGHIAFYSSVLLSNDDSQACHWWNYNIGEQGNCMELWTQYTLCKGKHYLVPWLCCCMQPRVFWWWCLRGVYWLWCVWRYWAHVGVWGSQ